MLGPTPGASWIGIIFGVWLVVSAILWTHLPAERISTAISGGLIAIVAWASRHEPRARYLNAPLAGWVFLAAIVLPTATTWTQWNNAIVAIVVFMFAFVPGRERFHPRHDRAVPV